MPFVEVIKSRNRWALSAEPQLTMAAYLADGKNFKGKSVGFRLTRSLVDALGWELTEKSISIKVNEGIGDDAGFLQLLRGEPGFLASTSYANKSGTQGISFSSIDKNFKHYVLNECPVPAVIVQFDIIKDTLLVACPDWLRYDPTTVTEDQLPPKKETVVEIKREPERMLNRQDRRAIGSKVARLLK